MNSFKRALKGYKVDFIALEDKPDTVIRIVRKCVERPDFMVMELPESSKRTIRQRGLTIVGQRG